VSRAKAAKRRRRAARAPRQTSLATTEAAADERSPTARQPETRLVLGVGIGVGVLSLALYLLTLDTSLPTGDSGELISAAAVLGVAHPPGYPLFTLLGHLALLLPVGSDALRVNVLSAFLDATAVSVVYFAIHVVLVQAGTGARAAWNAVVAAAVGALLLAFSTTFWAYATVAEVFALNDLFAASLFLLAFCWVRNPASARLGWLSMFVLGLSLSNQETIVLITPALAVLAWLGVRRLSAESPGWRPRGRTLVIGLAAFLAGLAPYVYIPIAASRHPLVDWGNPTSLGRFVDLILRKSYGTLSVGMGTASGSPSGQLTSLFENLDQGYIVVGLLFALVGAVWAWQNCRAIGVALVAGFVVSGPIFVAYANPAMTLPVAKTVFSRFYILPAIPLAILAGMGAFAVLAGLEQIRRLGVSARAVVPVAAALLLAVPAASAALHYTSDDRRGDTVELHFADDLLESLPRNAIFIFSGDDYWEGITYAQVVDHTRTDVITLDTAQMGQHEYLLQLRREHPTLDLPLGPYDSAAAYNRLIGANLGTHAVFVDGVSSPAGFAKPFEQVYDGLAIRLVRVGSIRNPYALYLAHAKTYEHLHYPTQTYAPTSWESLIARNYAACAFSLGLALGSRGGRADIASAERMYAVSIALSPTLADAYRYLGTLLLLHGGSRSEVVLLFRRYLSLSPYGPAANAVRRALSQLAAASPTAG
jgi:Protein of unknown function (DUF2723)